jgi:U2-associated protein SR140
VSLYTAGTVKKSRREKEQEVVEAKKREEEANAAKAYAEFLDAFESEDVGKKNAASSFVKSGEGFAPAAPRGQSERRPHIASTRVSNRVRGLASVFILIFYDHDQSPSPLSMVPKPKGKRAMDTFLEEIKRSVLERAAHCIYETKLVFQRASRT